MGDLAVLDGDLGGALRQPLAGPDVEGHPRPAPVVDRQPGRNERLGLRLGVDVGLLAVTRDARRGHPPGSVLAPHDVARGIERVAGDRAQDLDLLVAQGIRLECRRWLHGDEADQLEQMVLHHIA